jgi:hypothetical protein
MESNFAASDDAIVRLLGEGFRGRRYLRYADLRSLGLISNRATLRLWIERGAFPAGIRLPAPYGTTLAWSAAEVATMLAERFAERGGLESKRPATKTRLDPLLPKRRASCADDSACAQPINERAKARS